MGKRSDRLAQQYERRRLLRLLSKRTAVLEEPLRNPVMQKLVDEDLAVVTKRQNLSYGTKAYPCVYISITDKGRVALDLNGPIALTGS